MTVFFLYGRCCSFLGPTIFDGPYCWLFNCSYFASIIIIIIGAVKKSIKDKRKSNLTEKKLHNAFFSSTEFRNVRSWDWLKKGDVKKATEGTLMAAQEQAIRTRSIKHHIDKEIISPLCRICGEREETVGHLISECKNLAQKQYKQWRHDKIAQVIYWQLCKDHNLEHAEKWYDHSPQVTVENDKVEIIWDMKIQTDKVLKHSRPDILVLEKDQRICKIIDVTCSFDTRIIEKRKRESGPLPRPKMGIEKDQAM